MRGDSIRIPVAFKDVDGALIGVDAELIGKRPRFRLGRSDQLSNDHLEVRQLFRSNRARDNPIDFLSANHAHRTILCYVWNLIAETRQGTIRPSVLPCGISVWTALCT